MGIHLEYKINIPVIHQRFNDRVNGVHEFIFGVGILFQRQFAVFNFTHIQNIIDQSQQEITGIIDIVQILTDHLNVVLFLRQMGQTDDGIHNAYNQYKIKSIILYIIVFLSLRMLLDQHDHENCRCKIVGLYMPHILFPVF